MLTADVLRYLTDLASGPTSGGHPAVPEGTLPEAVDLTRSREMPEWLGTSVLLPHLALPNSGREAGLGSAPLTPALRHLAALDALQPAEHLLRIGWVVVAGTVTVEGRTLRCCFPLLSQPVRLRPAGFRAAVVPVGAPELTPLVTDAATAARLEATAEHGGGALDPISISEPPSAELLARLPRLQGWIRAVVTACGLPPLGEILPPSADPLHHRNGEGLVAVVGCMFYAARDVFRTSAQDALRTWSTRPGSDKTAFARLYRPATSPPEASTTPVSSPLPLSAAQAAAVQRARRDAITVVSGPPGSGKTHTLAAIAIDAVAAGASVLVATRSTHAADVVTDMLGRGNGPDPVRFGGAQNDDIVHRSTSRGASGHDVADARRALTEALAHQQMVERAIGAALAREQQAGRAPSWDGMVGELRALAPGAFDGTADLDRLHALLDSGEPPNPASWWRRWRAQRALHRLKRVVDAPPAAQLPDLRLALRCATDRRAAADLAAKGGTRLAPLWAQLDTADAAVRDAAGHVADIESSREDRRRKGRSTANDLATALRAGRRQRRRLLRQLDGDRLVKALPLWVGTLGDVDDLLPDAPGLFDLVILDEASQIDQVSAAGALLRGRRAVIVGDPNQLRHVSFLGDEQQQRALVAHGLEAAAARLDIRRASVLDVAAGTAPVTWLDEHHRSVPHLIEFSARRFYDGRLLIATRHPANEVVDAIGVTRVAVPEGTDAADAELTAALEEVAALAGAGVTDIALVSPFRELADAGQAALLAHYDLEDVERLRLRVGTVHGFQGAEADHVVLVFGLSPDDPPARRRFVEDPHLFNVMVTRAKRSLTVVTSLPPVTRPSPTSLVEQYLAHADRPPAAPADAPPPTSWGAALAAELSSVGLPPRTGYPVGRWTVDLCLGEGAGEAAAVETSIHGDGVDAHIERHRALRVGGWRHLDGHASLWDHDAARAAIELSASFSRPGQLTTQMT